MCGFAGEFLLGPGRADPSCAERMARALTHRGPDQAATLLSPDGRCAMAVQRLAVIDPAGSAQPMALPDHSLLLAFNGEIYNFPDLRRSLLAAGAPFRSDGDTEVLLHLFGADGPAMLDRLDGMFAFAIYDNHAAQLFLARDRLGQKPLWYALLDDRIVFASEAKALFCHPSVGRHPDRQAITFYATLGYIPAPLTAWQGVRKLPPASSLTLPSAEARPFNYWQPIEPTADLPSADIDDIVRHAVSHAVEARMLADVPIGALLSGGVDSAIVVALMARLAGRAGGVRTFTAGFDAADYDERPAARLVAEHCDTDHTELTVSPDPAGMLDTIVALYDEPFGDSSALPTFLICQAARRHVTVALSGDGGDEVFAGYDRYRAMHLAEGMGAIRHLAVRFAAALLGPFASHDERSAVRRFIRFADGLSYPFATQYLRYRALFAPEDLPRLFTDEFAAGVDLNAPGAWFCHLYEEQTVSAEAVRAQRHDLLTYLPDDLLVKADIASMACSLELRAPMLDHRVIDLGLSLPISAKIAGGRGKAVLARAFGDLLPPEVFQRPKRGFAVPLGRWLRQELRPTLRQSLLAGPLLDQGICRREALAGLVNDHLLGRDDHRHRLWALMVLSRWLARQE